MMSCSCFYPTAWYSLDRSIQRFSNVKITLSVEGTNIDPKGTLLSVLFAYPPSLQSRRNFGERVPSIFSAIIMAAIFDVNSNGKLGRERNFYQWGERQSKTRRGVGMGKIFSLFSLFSLKTSMRKEIAEDTRNSLATEPTIKYNTVFNECVFISMKYSEVSKFRSAVFCSTEDLSRKVSTTFLTY